MRRGALVLCVLALASCSSSPPPQPAPPSLRALTWREVTLPAADATVQDVAFCDDHWLAVGGLPTGPAAWRSTDGMTWTGVRLAPVSFYGRQSTISTVACRGADTVAVGAASGGAHGNPRTSTWRSRPDGSWLEYEPAFTQFGGQDSVGVGTAAAALGPPAGWAIVGNWLGPDGSPGPALWHSTDGMSFERTLVAPGSSARATDVAPLPGGGGWLVAGEAYGATLTGASWTSRDGTTWTPVPVGGPLALVTPYGDGTLGVGAAGAWWYDGTTWQKRGTLGDANGWRFLALSATSVLGAVTVAAGSSCRLWTTRDGGATWQEAAMPAPLPVTAETVAATAISGDTLLLATDDGTRARLWLTTA
ncbi:hypothetical protein RB614_13905 [Phytohabitans sp. ZYX-F-186]|uniref:Photosynthesis system II assembly factor Ycf48/Hcf136-like domain-containing protein n=1 Tax=Phytohabitans maris TaxID=3071409 RepID=A0ABU0ZEY1_9ACTN|nr:hypothetical protein [Phytohabitans sp. ZYX-F-186]MDQ7905611.1 hypothetical protein [Phytohabitans sp. ZYX-F-186]